MPWGGEGERRNREASKEWREEGLGVGRGVCSAGGGRCGSGGGGFATKLYPQKAKVWRKFSSRLAKVHPATSDPQPIMSKFE